MNPYPGPSVIETKTLEPVKVAVVQRVSKSLIFHSADVDAMADLMTNDMVLRLEALVYSDPAGRYHKEHTIVEEPAHPTWKHHLIASLPPGGFRRRFCGYFFDIPADYVGKRITHKVTVDTRALVEGLQGQYPPGPLRILMNNTIYDDVRNEDAL